jgi:hypothetical protein
MTPVDKRLTISIAVTAVLGMAVALSFVTGAVGIYTYDDELFTISMVLSSVMTIGGIVFCITAFYMAHNRRIDDDALASTKPCLYYNGDLYNLGFWLIITIVTSLSIIGLFAFGIKIADSTWGCLTIIPLIFMHVNAGFIICWAYYPFEYIKKTQWQRIVAMPIESTEATESKE